MNNDNKKYLFTSERLGYRLLNENDFDDYFKLDSNPEVRKFFQTGTLSAEKVKSNMQKNMEFFKENNFGVFIVIELKTGAFVGRCGLGKIDTGEIEVGYVFLPQFWGHGLATEALIALINWAKHNIQVTDTIIAFTSLDHTTSQRVMEKAGMTYYKKDINTRENQECVFYQIKLR